MTGKVTAVSAAAIQRRAATVTEDPLPDRPRPGLVTEDRPPDWPRPLLVGAAAAGAAATGVALLKRSTPAQRVAVGVLALSSLALAACSSDGSPKDGVGRAPTPTQPPQAGKPQPKGARTPPRIQLKPIATGLDNPVWVGAAPGEKHLYVVEQGGRIVRLQGDRRETVLDISDQTSSGGEQGLLSMAFHPDFASNRRFFVNHTDNEGDTRVVEYRMEGDGTADPDSERLLLHIPQPYSNHNGGQLQFGPDGQLYIGMGDGGSAGDPENRAQNPKDLLGKLLRVDVDGAGSKSQELEPEVYALGLRNPWRFSFDRATGDLYIGDVGQGDREEIDYLPAGAASGSNFGWDAFEGSRRFSDTKLTGEHVPPIAEYSHDDGYSVTGGYVYRGRDMPALRGYYVYADFGNDWIRTFRVRDGKAVGQREFAGAPAVSSFGEDNRGELYATSLEGTVYRLTGR